MKIAILVTLSKLQANLFKQTLRIRETPANFKLFIDILCIVFLNITSCWFLMKKHWSWQDWRSALHDFLYLCFYFKLTSFFPVIHKLLWKDSSWKELGIKKVMTRNTKINIKVFADMKFCRSWIAYKHQL